MSNFGRWGIFSGRFSRVYRPNFAKLWQDIGYHPFLRTLFQNLDILLHFKRERLKSQAMSKMTPNFAPLVKLKAFAITVGRPKNTAFIIMIAQSTVVVGFEIVSKV